MNTTTTKLIWTESKIAKTASCPEPGRFYRPQAIGGVSYQIHRSGTWQETFGVSADDADGGAYRWLGSARTLREAKAIVKADMMGGAEGMCSRCGGLRGPDDGPSFDNDPERCPACGGTIDRPEPVADDDEAGESDPMAPF